MTAVASNDPRERSSARDEQEGEKPGFQGPLAKSYPAAVALVVFALVPFLVVSGALFSLGPVIERSLSLSPHAFGLTAGFANAAYAFGTVLAVQFAVHRHGRRMLLLYVSTFILASALAAWAPSPAVFAGALVVQGLCTSLMLIAAVPPLVTGWPAAKMPWTAFTMNLCIFGAVAVGPTIGGLLASSGVWRALFWAVAGLGVLALVFALLTFEDQPPQDRRAPVDVVAVGLAAVGSATAFFGATQLETTRSADPASLVPLLAGIAMLVAIVIHQYCVSNPLMPVKRLATTFPVAALVVIVCASSSAFGLMEVVQTALAKRSSPAHIALLFLPEFGAAVLTAIVFGLVLRTRFIPVLSLAGLVMLSAAAAMLVGVAGDSGTTIAIASALIGLGVGASVSPSLFTAGLSLRSAEIQRVFALIELLRGVAAFLFAPILLYIVAVAANARPEDYAAAGWICLAITIGGGILATTLFVLGRGQLQAPDLNRWQKEGEPAWDSPPLLELIRRRHPTPRRGSRTSQLRP